MAGIIGFAWYNEAQWNRLREVSIDRSQLEMTHNEWLQSAEQKYIGLKLEGFNIVKINVDVDALVKWCREHKLPLNGDSRSRYAMAMVQQLGEAGESAT